ncbi:MAG: type II toxin-antitoxin system HicB family antitoxin [Phycisphaerae bacterium]
MPGFPGADSQGQALDELHENLRHVIEMLVEHGEPPVRPQFVGIQNLEVA